MNLLNIIRKTCSLICILLLFFIGGALIAPVGIIVAYLTSLIWLGHAINFAIGWWIGGSPWFINIVESIWNFKYD